jgi:hypothetical protein
MLADVTYAINVRVITTDGVNRGIGNLTDGTQFKGGMCRKFQEYFMIFVISKGYVAIHSFSVYKG